MYTEKVMENFTNPKNVGEVENANAVGQVGSPACGDIMKMSMKINDDGIIEDVKFKTYGCGAAIATSSVATEMIKGKHVDEARKLTNQQVIDDLGGLPPAKIHCSVLAAVAIQAALEDWEKNKEEAKTEA